MANPWGDSGAAVGVKSASPGKRSIFFGVVVFGCFLCGWIGGSSAKRDLPPSRVIPGEFESHEGLIISWPSPDTGRFDGHYARLASAKVAQQRQLLADIVRALAERIEFTVLVPNESSELEAARFFAQLQTPAKFQYLKAPVDTLWVRDFGPLMAKSSDGGYEVINTQFSHRVFGRQTHVPAAVAEHLRLPLVDVSLTVKNGNLLSNGSGVCVTSTRLMKDNQTRSARTIERILRERLGARQVVFLEPLQGESTGHIDMFMTFTAHDSVVIGRYPPEVDSVNAAILDSNARRLAAIQTPSGPMRVSRIPMPPHTNDMFPTYTNVVYANGVVLVPTYPHVAPDPKPALEIYRQLMPGWRVVGVDCTHVIGDRGALHCATMNLIKTSLSSKP